MNTVQLIGRLTKEIDLKFTPSGHAVGTFNLAVNRNFKNQAGEYEADFIRCKIWRKAAENLAKYTHKGSLIGIEGRIQTRHFENDNGERIYITEVVASNFYLLESKKQGQIEAKQDDWNNYTINNQNASQDDYEPNNNIVINDEDLPF